MFARIEASPTVCHGKPRIKGTRVLVSQIVLAIAAGDSISQVADDYNLDIDDVIAALKYAGHLAEIEEYITV